MPNTQSSHPLLSYSELRDLLELFNPAKDKFTCVGDAPSQGRRCQKVTASWKVSVAEGIIRQLPQLLQDHRQLLSRLDEVAECASCYLHKKKAFEVAESWHDLIVREIELRERRHSGNPERSRTRPRSTTTFESRTTPQLSSQPRAAPQASHQQTAVSQQPHQRDVAPQSTQQQSIALRLPSRLRTDSTVDTQTTSSLITTEIHHDLHHHNRCIETESARTTLEDECDICCEPLNNPCETPCGHRYCRECISTWLSHSETCPYDRLPLRIADLTPVQTATAQETACSICFEAFVAPCRTPCGHTFCRECISAWLRSQGRLKTCPLDRRPLSESDLISTPES